MKPAFSLESPAQRPGFAYSDLQSLQRIKTDGDGIRAAAQQFESLFIGMMLKGMRDANAALAEGSMLDSPELSMHEEMLDQQWAIHMAESGGIGLAPIIEAQLRGARTPSDDTASAGAAASVGAAELRPAWRSLYERTAELRSAWRSLYERTASRPRSSGADIAAGRPLLQVSPTPQGSPAVPGADSAVTLSNQGFKTSGFADREAFVAQVLPEIERALNGLVISPHAVLAQSALETGWGRHVIHGPDGASSHNLFGIKAGRGWQGEQVTVKTLEVIDGRPEVQSAEFRSYPSVRAAVEDYVRLLHSDPRYRKVLESVDGDAFANALQQSGYATDPAYARKIKAVLGSLRAMIGA